MAAIDGCDRDAWQPKTAADGDTERADAKRGAEDAWQPKTAADGDTERADAKRGAEDAWQPKTAADGDTRGADAKRNAEGLPLMGTARGDIDEGRLMEAALVILTVGRGEGLLEGVIF